MAPTAGSVRQSCVLPKHMLYGVERHRIIPVEIPHRSVTVEFINITVRDWMEKVVCDQSVSMSDIRIFEVLIRIPLRPFARITGPIIRPLSGRVPNLPAETESSASR